MDKKSYTPEAAGDLSLIGKGFLYLRTYGIRHTWKKVFRWVQNRNTEKWIVRTPLFTREALADQRRMVFPRDITFSILVPLYNTPESFLREMIQSVQDQTYGKWELCLADGSDQQHPEVGRICKQYAHADPRILYQKLEKNMGISENTNVCISMSHGEYIALFDHDDVLHPAALHEVMKAICDQDADYIYTDETTFESPDITKVISPHFKPDYGIDTLRANNYICHLSVFKRELLEKAGGFRSEYDGSQDHDLILRLTKYAKKVVHIPEVLYYWRSHPTSVAMDISSKEYAIRAGRNAVKASIQEAGDTAEVESSAVFPTIYRIRYGLRGADKVSVLLPAVSDTAALEQCVDSILEKTAYPNYEIVVAGEVPDAAAAELREKAARKNIKMTVLQADGDLPVPRLYDLAAGAADGDDFLLMDPCLRVLSPEWMEELLMYVQREDVAAAGSLILAPDGSIRSGWRVLGMGADGAIGDPLRGLMPDDGGYMGRLAYAQDVTAVCAGGMLVGREAYRKAGGFDPALDAAYWDADFCMRLRTTGSLIVWTPYSRLRDDGPGEKPSKQAQETIRAAANLFKTRWSEELSAGDPYYNPNFRLDRNDFSLKSTTKLRYIRPV